MDFSLGGLGWLLENQLMWNNLVPLGGELHQFRGNPHYSMQRIEESTISSWLAYISVENVPTGQSRKKISHLLLDYAFHSSLFFTGTAALSWPEHFLFVSSVFNIIGGHPFTPLKCLHHCRDTPARTHAAYRIVMKRGRSRLKDNLSGAGNGRLSSPGIQPAGR